MSDATSLRNQARRHRRMADEIAGYPTFEGRDERVREHRAEAQELYRQARELERPRRSPSGSGTRSSSRPAAPKTSRDRAATGAVVGDRRDGFDARKAMRRAGLAGLSAGDRAARKARKAAQSSAVTASSGAGDVVVYVIVSLLGLLLLEALIAGRGPKAVATSLGWFGSVIARLVSASDPIVKQGIVPAAATPPSTTTSSSSTKTSTSSSSSGPIAGVGRGAQTLRNSVLPGT